MCERVAAASKKREDLTEFDWALLDARTKLKTTADKLEERRTKLTYKGQEVKRIGRMPPYCVECETKIREFIEDDKAALKHLDERLNGMRKEVIKKVCPSCKPTAGYRRRAQKQRVTRRTPQRETRLDGRRIHWWRGGAAKGPKCRIGGQEERQVNGDV